MLKSRPVRVKLISIFVLSVALLYAQDSASTPPQTRAANGAGVQPPPQPASFDCSVDGTVVNSVTGEPIARAKVNLTVAGTTYSTASEGSGQFLLTDVGCAPGMLQVTRPGFLIAGNNGNPGSIQRQLRLVSGSPVHGIKLSLMPQSVAVGKVLDDQGDPLQGAQVTALVARVNDGHQRFQQAGSSVSNDIGEYRLAGLQPGKYIFCVHINNPPALQNQQRTVLADSCYPGPVEGGAASAMELTAGREAKADFNLNQTVAVHIRGTMTGVPEGRGVGVNLVESIPNADINRSVNGPVRDGKFDFRVTPGAYMLTSDYFENGKHLTARVPVSAGNSDIDNVAVHLDEGFTVGAVIRYPSQSSAAPQQFGIGLRPLEQNGGGQIKWSEDHTTVSISDITPGTYRLNANPPAPYYVKSATLGGQDILNNWIPIAQSGGQIEVTLQDDGGSVEGDVVDASGQAVASGVLLLRGTTRVATSFAGANGHFKIQNVPPGDYTVFAWDNVNDVQYAETDWMRRYGSGGVPVSVTASQSAQVKLTQQMMPAE